MFGWMDTKSSVMRILAENTGPIDLSMPKVAFTLPICAEYDRILKNNAGGAAGFFLRFENIFGTEHCPNFDIHLISDSQSSGFIHLGAVSLFGIRPKSSNNLHGTAQSVSIRESTGYLISETLQKSNQLSLILVARAPLPEGASAVIETIYLCGELRCRSFF